MSSSIPYDPYVPPEGTQSPFDQEDIGFSNSTNNQQQNNNHQPSRTAQLQAEIDDTVGIMRDNINKVAERGERLTSIEDKADNLAVSAQGFKRGANRVRKQMWWKDLKMRMCLVLVVIILLVVIIVPIVIHFT